MSARFYDLVSYHAIVRDGRRLDGRCPADTPALTFPETEFASVS